MTAEEEGRQKAISQYRIVACLMGLMSVGLLVAAILAVTSYDGGEKFGPPYYLGGFIGGIMGLVYTLICVFILLKAPHMGNDDIKKRELSCAITGQYILSMFMFMGCFMGIVFAGIGGLSSSGFGEEEVDPAVKTIAICIMIGCIVVLGVNIFGMCTVCTYGMYFGVRMTKYRRGQRVLIMDQGNSMHGTGLQVYTTSTGVSNDQIQNLETQNRLLQQQLQLQQMLNQQNNIHNQPAYPPPPPTY